MIGPSTATAGRYQHSILSYLAYLSLPVSLAYRPGPTSFPADRLSTDTASERCVHCVRSIAYYAIDLPFRMQNTSASPLCRPRTC